MLIDTHCHMNMMVKNNFDQELTKDEIDLINNIVEDAKKDNVSKIINVGTSLIESKNCIEISKKYKDVFVSIGIHPNDLTSDWKKELNILKNFLIEKEKNKIVAIGETGLDMYRPGFDLQKQKDAFKTQIEIALENDLALIVHTRTAPEETLEVLEQFKNNIKRCVIHCFSEGLDFAKQVINWGFYIGIGGTITYPKNDLLREVCKAVNLENIVLETDAPFLPPQIIRGKQNSPKYIKAIAQYLSEIRNQSFEEIAKQTALNSCKLFNI